MKRFSLALIGVFISLGVFSQAGDPESETIPTPSAQAISTQAPSAEETISADGRIDPRRIQQGGQWNPRMNVIDAPPIPGQLSEEKALIRQLTEEKVNRQRSGATPTPGADDDKGGDFPEGGANAPTINESWQGINATLNPPDNAMAISTGGKIVSSVNSRIAFHETDGTETFSSSLSDFFSPVSPNATVFDPRVIYLANYDRFAIVVCNGSTPSTSRLFIAFSTTNNPADPWWFYSWSGTTCTASTSWFDFPSVGYSNDLYVSGNLFNASNSFTGCIIRQINLSNAFTGGIVSSTFWCEVDQDNGDLAFTIKPLSHGFGITYGPGIVLASTRSGDKLFYYYITQNQGNSPVLNTYESNVGAYSAGGNALQSGSANTMDGGGTRIRDGFYANGALHTIWSIDRSGGENGLRYARTDFVSGVSEVSSTFGATGFDYTYPAIQPWGTTFGSWDGSAVVAFLRSGSTVFPQFRAAYVDPNLVFSGSFLVKAGETPIVNGNGNSRWGDYIEGCRRQNGAQPEVWFYGQYGRNNTYGNWHVQLVENIPGCTNPSACNYNPQATLNDGSCDLSSCVGCLDPAACNYNASATISGFCLYPGCTQSSACNYSWLAGCDDGSCCFDNCVRINMFDSFGDGWNGNTYVLTDLSGTVVSSGTLSTGSNGIASLGCIDDGCYLFTVDGGTFPQEITWTLEYTFGNFLFGGTPPLEFAEGGAPYQENLTIGDAGADGGCTDVSACNYDPSISCDDGSCCYSNCLTITMFDSFGDGWNNNLWEIFDPATNTVVDSGTLSNGSTGIDNGCLTAGCYVFRINTTNGFFENEVSYQVTGADGGSFSGTAADQTPFIIGGGSNNTGCTDFNACNYDGSATCDDGSCCYANCGNLLQFDSFGDGWNGAVLSIFDDNNILVASVGMPFSLGSTANELVCLGPGCYTIEVSGGTFPGEISWLLSVGGSFIGGGAPFSGTFNVGTISGCTDPNACNFNPIASCEDESCVYPGCTDPGACNYDPFAACDAGNCQFACYGCTYSDATNYNPAATSDNGSCVFECDPNTCPADLDNNGVVNTSDLLNFLASFGSICN